MLTYLGQWKKEWYGLSKAPHVHEGLGTMFLRYRCALSVLHSIRNRAWRICPSLKPALKYFGGINLFLLRLFLKEMTVFAFLIYAGRLFQALTVEGRNELKIYLSEFEKVEYDLSFASCRDWHRRQVEVARQKDIME